MINSVPKKHFKRHLGQANHFLVTILIGLNAIEEGLVAEKPESFSTSWNPKDRLRSAIRSRQYALASSLGWAVDSLDMYISLLNRNPKYISNANIERSYGQWGRSVHAKAMGIAGFFPVDELSLALIDVLITWRNNSHHYLAENKVSSKTKDILIQKNNDFLRCYRGLDTSGLALKAEKGAELSFKEVASLIKAVQDFVEQVDRQVLGQLNIKEFFRAFIIEQLSQNMAWRKKYFEKIEVDRENFLRNILQNELSFNGVNEDLALCMNITKGDLG